MFVMTSVAWGLDRIHIVELLLQFQSIGVESELKNLSGDRRYIHSQAAHTMLTPATTASSWGGIRNLRGPGK